MGFKTADLGTWTATPLQRCTSQWHRYWNSTTLSEEPTSGFDTNSHFTNAPQNGWHLPFPCSSSDAWVSTSKDRSRPDKGSADRFCTHRLTRSVLNTSVATKIGTDCIRTSTNEILVHVVGWWSINADKSISLCQATAFGKAKYIRNGCMVVTFAFPL